MIAKLKSVTMLGLNCNLIDTEVAISKGIHSFQIVGLPDNVISESRQRIIVSIKNSGFEFPKGKIVVNLAPSDMKKEGSAFDLPIAIGLLSFVIDIPKENLKKTIILGQLSLDGKLRSVNGVLSIAQFAKKNGYTRILIPSKNTFEASLVDGISIFGFASLKDVVAFLLNKIEIKPIKHLNVENMINDEVLDESLDMSYIKGQEMAKRALEISAAGSHNILMVGSPGSGKTLLGRAFPGILPRMTKEEIIEVTKLYSISGLLNNQKPLITKRPFRVVHHSASSASIIGGGRLAKPGEISLANRGAILFDEFAEFPNCVLENLRQPMEDKVITVSRVAGTVTYPAQFILLAAMNPCKCGYFGVADSRKECSCSLNEVYRYQKKISGPILDRIDLYLSISPVKIEELTSRKIYGDSSKEIRKRVQKARDIQIERFKKLKISCNSEMTVKEIYRYCDLDSECEKIYKSALEKFNFTARSYHHTLKVSRTIADLEGCSQIKTNHILEALQYRKKDQ